MTLTRSIDLSLPLGKFIRLSVDELRHERGKLAAGDLDSAIEKFDREWHAARNDEAKAKGHSLKERRALSDSLARVCGKDPRQMTATEAKTCGVKMSEIIRVMPDVSEGELFKRAAKYRVLYPNAALTPSSLNAHWSECGHTELPRSNGGAAKLELSLSAEPASEWRAVAQEVAGQDTPLAEWIRDGREWDRVPASVREKTLRILAQ